MLVTLKYFSAPSLRRPRRRCGNSVIFVQSGSNEDTGNSANATTQKGYSLIFPSSFVYGGCVLEGITSADSRLYGHDNMRHKAT